MGASEKGKDDTMKRQTLGGTIAALRKEKGMTQLELAEQMGVTDKAVSKWERDLACPDVSSLPKLAQLLGVTLDELMQNRANTASGGKGTNPAARTKLLGTICLAVALAQGIAVIVLSLLNQLDVKSAVNCLAIGLLCLSIHGFINNNRE